jgi:thiamine biosynthesis lipoprotein
MKNLLFFCFLVFISCNSNIDTPQIVQGNAFGTTYTVKFYSEKNFNIEKAIDSIVYQINKSVSTYQSNSAISKINNGDTTVTVDKIFVDNFTISKKVYEVSNGYFDPSVGILRNAYGFGDTNPLKILDKKTLDSLMVFVGFDKIELSENNIILKEHPQIYIDFNAVAKGYGIDRIGAILKEQGVNNFLIELGGEILASGKNLEQDKEWLVGIESVESEIDNRSHIAKIALLDMAMASSGNYRKFRIDPITGETYVHTINPLSGKAEKNDVTSAAVLAFTCAYADAYATAFMAMGLERSKEVLNELEYIEAYLTYNDHDGVQRVFMTDGFRNYLRE